MAESIVKVPSQEAQGLDFLAFSFNGKHSWDDFHIYRTSDGDRYNENLTPTLADKTAEVPGGDGMYYFGTTHKQRDFNISFAFDSLTEVQLRELKKWLNGKEMGDLWFQEAPYKVWTAKPAGNSSIKYIPFDDKNGQRVYKGEGTVQFVAYWPYAHTPDYIREGSNKLIAGVRVVFQEEIKTRYLYVEKKESGNVLFTFYKKNGGYIQRTTSNTSSVFDLGSELTIVGAYADVDCELKLWATTASAVQNITDQNKRRIYFQTDGKNLVAYNEFANKDEWAVASGLSNDFTVGDNQGAIPATFVFTKTGSIANSNDVTAIFTVGDLSITIPAESSTTTGEGDEAATTYVHYKNLTWDSKTGIVTANKNNDADGVKPKPISYTGTSLGAIPEGGITNWGKRSGTVSFSYSTEGCTLTYHYWYY